METVLGQIGSDQPQIGRQHGPIIFATHVYQFGIQQGRPNTEHQSQGLGYARKLVQGRNVAKGRGFSRCHRHKGPQFKKVPAPACKARKPGRIVDSPEPDHPVTGWQALAFQALQKLGRTYSVPTQGLPTHDLAAASGQVNSQA
jgi:hypothetical protein